MNEADKAIVLFLKKHLEGVLGILVKFFVDLPEKELDKLPMNIHTNIAIYHEWRRLVDTGELDAYLEDYVERTPGDEVRHTDLLLLDIRKGMLL